MGAFHKSHSVMFEWNRRLESDLMLTGPMNSGGSHKLVIGADDSKSAMRRGNKERRDSK